MEYVSHLFLGLLLAVILGQMIIPRVMVISLRKRLFDVPDARKVHHVPISRLGGVTFFPVIVLVMCGISLLLLNTGFWPHTLSMAYGFLPNEETDMLSRIDRIPHKAMYRHGGKGTLLHRPSSKYNAWGKPIHMHDNRNMLVYL